MENFSCVLSLVLITMIWSQLPLQLRARKERDDLKTTENPNVTLGWGPKEVYPFSIDDALKQCKIVPMIIDKSPKHIVEVLYEDENVVDFGVYLRPDDMMFEPKMIKWPEDGGYYYTLIIADADVPTRADYSDNQFLLWMVVNARDGKWKEEDVIAPYIRPEPDLESGQHRVLHLVYKQPKKLHIGEPRIDEERNNSRRQNFIVRDFAKKYKLGQPHAINFFFVENWDIVNTEAHPLAMSDRRGIKSPLDALDELELEAYMENVDKIDQEQP